MTSYPNTLNYSNYWSVIQKIETDTDMEFLFFVAKYIIDEGCYQCLCGVASVNKTFGCWSWRSTRVYCSELDVILIIMP